MKRIISAALKILAKKLCMSFVFFAMLFLIPLVENIKYGAAYYSAFICILLFYWLCRDLSREGRKHMSKTQTPFLGLFIGLAAESVTLLLCLVMLIFKQSFSGANILYLLFNISFAGFLSPEGNFFEMTFTALYFLPVVLVPLFSAAAYYLGYRQIDFWGEIFNKLIFKSGGDEK